MGVFLWNYYFTQPCQTPECDLPHEQAKVYISEKHEMHQNNQVDHTLTI